MKYGTFKYAQNPYGERTRVFGTISVSWDVYKLTLQTLTVKWNVFKQVTQTLSVVWNVLKQVIESISILWNLRSSSGIYFTPIYNVDTLWSTVAKIGNRYGQFKYGQRQYRRKGFSGVQKPSTAYSGITKPQTAYSSITKPQTTYTTIDSAPR